MEIEIPSIPSEFKNVTVLLPDHLLCHSTTISSKIANATIVADSTFGSCCIDQTTISHTATDCIVKYGDSCLSKPNTTIPIYHVFDTFPVAIDLVIENLKQFEKVLVFTSTDCYHIMNKLSCNVIPTIIPTEYPIKPFAHTHSIRGRYFTLPDGITINDIPIVYVGQDTLELSSILMALPNAMIFDPVHNTLSADVKTSKAFGKRFFMVEKAKDADTIGIVVGTLSIDLYLHLIDDLKKMIIASGKKPYLLAVGKPNPAKLGNFLELDCFVMVSCPMNALVDSREFMKPVITPYELVLALTNGDWDSSKYELDLVKVAQNIPLLISELSLKDGEDEEPRFSLITGQYVSGTKYNSDAVLHGGLQVAEKAKGTVAQFKEFSSSAQFLNSRSYKGLEIQGETSVEIETGRKGIARGYTHEG